MAKHAVRPELVSESSAGEYPVFLFFIVPGMVEATTTAILRPIGSILCYAMAVLEIVTGA